MQDMSDVAIIGGGVIGCAIAYNLRKFGADVTVLDQGEIGAEASSAAAGLLAPLGSLSGPGAFADLLLASWALFPTLIPELEGASGITLEYEQTGALRLMRDARLVPNLRKRLRAWQPLGLRMEWLTGEEARQREPLLAPEISAAIYAPEESQIRASYVTRAFWRTAVNRGAVFYSHTEIVGLQRQNHRVIGIQTARGETISCNHLVIAAGAWAARCGEWLNISLPVGPQRGQILSLRQPVTPLQHMIFGEAVYLAPKRDGSVIVGATREEVGFDKQLTAGGIAWLLNTAIRLVPSLDGCPIEAMWVGLRPKTPDQQPILGKVPGWENVVLATGHGSVGIMLSAITGKAIAELVLTGEVPEVIRAFSVERFADPAAIAHATG